MIKLKNKKTFFYLKNLFYLWNSKRKKIYNKKTQEISNVRNLAIHTNRWFRGNEILLSAGYCSVNPMTIDQSKPKENPGLKRDYDLS